MELVAFYTKLWELTGKVVNEEGYLRSVDKSGEGKTKPIIIDGKQIVMPTNEQLRMTDWENRVVFHPLWEDVQKGESPLLGYFRSELQLTLSHEFANLFLDLVTLAGDTVKHPSLTEEQLEFLRVFKRIDGADTMVTMFKRFQSILEKLNNTDRSLVKIYIKRLGLYKGQSYKAVAVVTFPLYDELCRADTEKDKRIWGVECAAKYRDTLKELYEYVFPNIAVAESYNYGSTDELAPKLNSVMMAFHNVASRLATVADVFEGHVTLSNKALLNQEIIEVCRNLRSMEKQRLSVPMQTGNETRPSEAAVEAVVRSVVPTEKVAETVSTVMSGIITPSGGLNLAAMAGMPRRPVQHDPFTAFGNPPAQRPLNVTTSNGGIDPRALMAVDQSMRPSISGNTSDFTLRNITMHREAPMPWTSGFGSKYSF